MDTKPIFKSKTAAFGFVTAVAGAAAFFFPGVEAYVSENAAGILFMIGLLSIALRKMTKGKVTLVPLLLLGLCFSALSLTSCGLQVGVKTTEEGCILVESQKIAQEGIKDLHVGYCPKTKHYVSEWSQTGLDGEEVRLRAFFRTKTDYRVEYQSGGVWIEWGPKSGIVVGAPPGAPREVEVSK